MKKKLIVLMMMFALTGTMLAGCGSSDTEDTDTTTVAEDADSSSDFDTSASITVVSREDGSGTRSAFVELTGVEEDDVDNTTVDAQVVNSTSVVMTTVASDEYAIGYISLGSLDDTVKAVAVEGVEATAENVKDGSYVISRPFNIAVSDSLENEVADDFISWILGEDGQAIVEENGYVTIDDIESYESTQPSGSLVVGGSSSVSPVMEVLIEAYEEVNPNAEIELQTTDSSTGITNAIDGSYDIGMASRELSDDEASQGLTSTVIAMDGIAVVVNNDNPIESLTLDQIKSIYVGDVTSWSEVE